MDRIASLFGFIFSSYKRVAALLVVAAILLAIPLTISILSQEQDIRQQASEGFPVYDENRTKIGEIVIQQAFPEQLPSIETQIQEKWSEVYTATQDQVIGRVYIDPSYTPQVDQAQTAPEYYYNKTSETFIPKEEYLGPQENVRTGFYREVVYDSAGNSLGETYIPTNIQVQTVLPTNSLSCIVKPPSCTYFWAFFNPDCRTPSQGWCPSGGSGTPTPAPTSSAVGCGDGVCQEVVCLGTNCPQPESAQTCPQDCSNPTPAPSGFACTADAKICPDGSTVSRTGPNCTFPACPGTKNAPCSIPNSNFGAGDVNRDGSITMTDSNLTSTSLGGLTNLDSSQKLIADVNASGSLTQTDALLIAQYALGSINTFPVCGTPTNAPTLPIMSPTISGPTPTSIAICPLRPKGDANCDGKINTDDFNIWRTEFLAFLTSNVPTPAQSALKANFAGGSRVNTDDFNIWRDGFLNPSIPH